MIVNCEKCAARYKLDDNKVTGRGARITCPKCRHVFVVFPQDGISASEADSAPSPAAATPAPPAPAATPAPPAPAAAAPAAPKPRGSRSAETLDFRKVGIASWKVRVRIGLVYDFSDIKTLRKYIQDGRVTPEDVISHNGKTWVTIGDIPDLDAYFVQVYEAAEATAEPGPTEKIGGFEDEDTPTMIVGMGTLGDDLAADALRQVGSDAVRTPNPSTPGADGPFVDPFAALKSKQRDRMQTRRTPAASTAAAAAAQPSPRRFLPVLGLLLVLGAGGYYAWTQRSQPPPPVQPTPTTNTPENPTPAGEASPQSELRERVQRTLQEAEPEPITPEQPDLVPVGPRDMGRTPNNPTAGGSDPGLTTSPISAVDHASNCTSFAGSGDWKQAVMACEQAARTSSSGAVMAAYGVSLYHTGNRSGAESQLRRAKDNGGGPVVLKYLGHIARDNGDSSGANGYYQQYLATNPPDRAEIEKEIR